MFFGNLDVFFRLAQRIGVLLFTRSGSKPFGPLSNSWFPKTFKWDEMKNWKLYLVQSSKDLLTCHYMDFFLINSFAILFSSYSNTTDLKKKSVKPWHRIASSRGSASLGFLCKRWTKASLGTGLRHPGTENPGTLGENPRQIYSSWPPLQNIWFSCHRVSCSRPCTADRASWTFQNGNERHQCGGCAVRRRSRISWRPDLMRWQLILSFHLCLSVCLSDCLN